MKSSETFVTLSVAAETYAVPVGSVLELVLLQPLTRVAAMPSSVRGLMNLRGTVIPIIDLARQLGLGETTVTNQTCVAVVETRDPDGAQSIIGVISDEVQDVVMLDGTGITAAPGFGSRVNRDYLVGMTRIGERYVLLLDLARILSPDELLAVTEAGQS